jgi:hypothetical protein
VVRVVMSFGGGWVGLGRKKGGAVPFRIYSSDFRNCTGTTIETGKGFANILKKTSVSYSKQYSKFANIKS